MLTEMSPAGKLQKKRAEKAKLLLETVGLGDMRQKAFFVSPGKQQTGPPGLEGEGTWQEPASALIVW